MAITFLADNAVVSKLCNSSAIRQPACKHGITGRPASNRSAEPRRMDKARSVLVVSRDPRRQAELQEWLAPAGYEVSAAEDFDTARRLLEVVAPDVLVADVKLGAYNGLHLAIWLRGRGLNTKAILIGQPDRVLQEEAARARAAYL